MALLAQASVAIDGNKFKAVNNRDKNFTRAKMQRRMAQIKEGVARYLRGVADAAGPEQLGIRPGFYGLRVLAHEPGPVGSMPAYLSAVCRRPTALCLAFNAASTRSGTRGFLDRRSFFPFLNV